MLIDFGQKGREIIGQLLTERLNATPDTCAALIDSMQRTGKVHFFGGGSLMSNHGEFRVTNAFRAALPGWRRRMVSYDTFYRGTPDKPGMTVSLTPAGENDRANGYVMEVALTDGNPVKECVHALDLPRIVVPDPE